MGSGPGKKIPRHPSFPPSKPKEDLGVAAVLSESILVQNGPKVGIPATCYRTENAQIPKSAGESAGKSAGKKGTAGGTAGAVPFLCFSEEKGLPALLPAVPPAVPFFPALFPALSPALLGIWAFSSQSCSRSLGFQPKRAFC